MKKLGSLEKEQLQCKIDEFRKYQHKKVEKTRERNLVGALMPVVLYFLFLGSIFVSAVLPLAVLLTFYIVAKSHIKPIKGLLKPSIYSFRFEVKNTSEKTESLIQ